MSTNDTTTAWTAAQHNDWLYAAFRDEKLPHRASVLGAAAVFQLGRKGSFRASLRELADAAGMSDRLTRPALTELRDAGYWRVAMRPGRMSYQIDLIPQAPGAPLEALEWHETLVENRRYQTKDRTAGEGYAEKADVLRELWRDPHTSLRAKRVGAAAIYRLAGHRSAFHAQTDELYAVSGATRKVARPAIAELVDRHYWTVVPIAASVASDRYTLLSPSERYDLWRKAERGYRAAVDDWLRAEKRHIREWSEGLQSFWAELLEMERKPYVDWFAAERAHVAQCNNWLNAEFSYQHEFKRKIFDLLTFTGIAADEALSVAEQKWVEHHNGLFGDVNKLASVMEGIKRAMLEESQPWGAPSEHRDPSRPDPTDAEIAAANDAWTAAAAADRAAQAALEGVDVVAETCQGAAQTCQGAAQTCQGAAQTCQGAAETCHEKLSDQHVSSLSHEGTKYLNDEDAAPSRTRPTGAPSGLARTDDPHHQHRPVVDAKTCPLCDDRGKFLDGSDDGTGRLLYEMFDAKTGRHALNIECQHSLEANLAKIQRIEVGGKWETTKSGWKLIDDYFELTDDEDVYDETGRIIFDDEDEYAYI